MSGHTPSPLWPGVPMALASAFLFGATAPLAKGMLGSIEPQLLAGLLYLGAGVGLAAVHAARNVFGIPAPEAPLRSKDFPWLAAIIVFGGILGPVLLMLGLNRTDAASGSLLLNLEGLATMIIAWVVFRENVDRRLLLGALAIIIGAIVLSWDGTGISIDSGALLIAGACVAWAIDNNLTRKLSSADPVVIAMTKGLIAGIANIGMAVERGVVVPAAIIDRTGLESVCEYARHLTPHRLPRLTPPVPLDVTDSAMETSRVQWFQLRAARVQFLSRYTRRISTWSTTSRTDFVSHRKDHMRSCGNSRGPGCSNISCLIPTHREFGMIGKVIVK